MAPIPQKLKLLTISNILKMSPYLKEVYVVVGELNFIGTDDTQYNWSDITINWNKDDINRAEILHDTYGNLWVLSWNNDEDFVCCTLNGWLSVESSYVECELPYITGKSRDELPKYVYQFYMKE